MKDKVKKWFESQLSMCIEESLDSIECEEIMHICMKAFNELEQYKAIGTVEDIQTMKDNGAFSEIELAKIAARLLRLKDYEAIGTIEEFKASKEKSETLKALYEDARKEGSNLIAKVEAYEKEQAEIKVGDVVYISDVANELEEKDEEAYGVVTGIYKNHHYEILMKNGDGVSFIERKIEKTGKHIDIQSILQQIGGAE